MVRRIDALAGIEFEDALVGAPVVHCGDEVALAQRRTLWRFDLLWPRFGRRSCLGLVIDGLPELDQVAIGVYDVKFSHAPRAFFNVSESRQLRLQLRMKGVDVVDAHVARRVFCNVRFFAQPEMNFDVSSRRHSIREVFNVLRLETENVIEELQCPRNIERCEDGDRFAKHRFVCEHDVVRAASRSGGMSIVGDPGVKVELVYGAGFRAWMPYCWSSRSQATRVRRSESLEVIFLRLSAMPRNSAAFGTRYSSIRTGDPGSTRSNSSMTSA